MGEELCKECLDHEGDVVCTHKKKPTSPSHFPPKPDFTSTPKDAGRGSVLSRMIRGTADHDNA